MSKNLFKGLFICSVALFVAGCSNTKVRTYVQEKQRVDQKMAGNAGYVFGNPKAGEQGPRKATRNVYVLEFTKDVDVPEEGVFEPYRKETEYKPQSRKVKKRVMRRRVQPQIPQFEFEDEMIEEDIVRPSAPVSGNFVQYTVKNDDTLQKISKKFYNAYSKWPEIYKANRDVLANPDSLSPGIVLRIPVEK